MKGLIKEKKIGMVAFVIFLLLQFLGSYVGGVEARNLLEFIKGMLVGLSLLAVIFEFVPSSTYLKIKEAKKIH